MPDPIELLNLRLALGDIEQANYDKAVASLRSRDVSGTVAASAATGTHRELYGIYRDYIKHEDDLINQRLGWNLAIQGFLFTAFGFVFQKTADLWNSLSRWYINHDPVPALPQPVVTLLHGLRELHWILLLLASAGLGVTVIVALGTQAANLALEALSDRWHALHPLYEASTKKQNTHSPDDIGLPGIRGGGNPKGTHTAFHTVSWLPWLLGGVWLLLGLNSVRELFVIARVASGQHL